jgi:protein-S-isoprenylcysteine O-methyltransferase Ste14
MPSRCASHGFALVADPMLWLARRRVTLGFVCGAAALWLARPTWATWAVGCGIALVGELVRIWAAGHLEKDREVTSSGPYRFMEHPLYVGSTIMGIGFAIAASHLVVAALVGLYLAATLAAAMRREQSFLERTFGDRYQAYRSGRDLDQAKRFSMDRARHNREYRAVAGFVAVALVLAAKAAMRCHR